MLVSLSDFSTRPVRHLERTSNSSPSTCPIGRVLWEELLSLVIKSGQVEFLSPAGFSVWFFICVIHVLEKIILRDFGNLRGHIKISWFLRMTFCVVINVST